MYVVFVTRILRSEGVEQVCLTVAAWSWDSPAGVTFAYSYGLVPP